MSIQQTILNVPDMHCESCPKLIRLSLLEIDGVVSVSPSLETKTVVVDFDSQKTSTNHLINSIHEIGYTATLQ